MFKKRSKSQQLEDDIRKKLISNLQLQKEEIDGAINSVKKDSIETIKLHDNFTSSEYYKDLYDSLDEQQKRILFNEVLTSSQVRQTVSNLGSERIVNLLRVVYDQSKSDDIDNSTRLLIIHSIDSSNFLLDRINKNAMMCAVKDTLSILLENKCINQPIFAFSDEIKICLFSVADKNKILEWIKLYSKDELFELVMKMESYEIYPFLQKMEFSDTYFAPEQNARLIEKMVSIDVSLWYFDVATTCNISGITLFDAFGVDGVKVLYDRLPSEKIKELTIFLIIDDYKNQTELLYDLYIKLTEDQKNKFLEIIYEDKKSIIQEILIKKEDCFEDGLSFFEIGVLALIENTEKK